MADNNTHEFDSMMIREEDQTFDELFLENHNPQQLYNSMKELERLVDETNGLDQKISNRLYVEIFQMGIQYLEMFGVYLLMGLQGKEPAQGLTTIDPSDIYEFGRFIRFGDIDDWFSANSTEGYHDRLRLLFGYSDLENREFEEISDETGENINLEELLAESIAAIEMEIEFCIQFYTRFSDIYNAIKHGDRVVPWGYVETATISYEEDIDETIEKQSFPGREDYLMFLCAHGSERRPYIFQAPAEYLLKEVWTAVDRIKPVYSHLRKVIDNQTEDRIKVPLYNLPSVDTESEDGEDIDWLIGRSGTDIWVVVEVPENESVEELSQQSERVIGTVSAKLVHTTDGLELEFDPEAHVSQEYPFEIITTQKPTSEFGAGLRHGFNIEPDISKLTLEQLLRYTTVAETIPDRKVTSVSIRNNRSEVERKFEMAAPIRLPELPRLPNSDLIDWVAKKQRALDQEVPIPQLELGEKQQEILIRYREQDQRESLDGEEIREMFNEIEKVGQESQWTRIILQEITSDRDVLREKYFDDVPWQYQPLDEFLEKSDLSAEEMSLESEGTFALVQHMIDYEKSYDNLIEMMEEDREKVSDEIKRLLEESGDEPADRGSDLRLMYLYTDQYRPWRSVHELRVQIVVQS